MAEAALEQLEAPVIDEDEATTYYETQDRDPNKHPLLNEDVLDNIFPYFSADSNNLGSFRLVHKAWNTSASRTVKKEIQWKIEPAPALHNEKRFIESMSKYRKTDEADKNIFQNVWWTHEKMYFLNLASSPGLTANNRVRHPFDENPGHENTLNFLSHFGRRIVNLRLRAADLMFVKHRLRSSYLPNLVHLELYDITAAVMKEEAFDEIQSFPKLKSICLTPKKGPRHDEIEGFQEAKSLICDKILEAAPKLTKLEINIPEILKKILKNERDTLTWKGLDAITSFKMAPQIQNAYPARLALDRIQFQNLLNSCPHLKVLCVTICGLVKQEVIYEILAKSKVCVQLEELDLVIGNCMIFDSVDYAERDGDPELNCPHFIVSTEPENEKSDSKDENAADLNASPSKRRRPTRRLEQVPLPVMPKLKKLKLQYWRLQDFDTFYNAPNLLHVDLLLNDASHLSVFGPNMNVKYLKVRGIASARINGHGIDKFSHLFPKLEELDVKLYNDEDLEAIFKHMQKLKRLNLSDSPITDEGITGIPRKELEEQSAMAWFTSECKRDASFLQFFRQKSFIGDLKDLQQFTHTGSTLTSFSIQYGIADLNNLTNFKLKPAWRAGHCSSMAHSHQGPSKSNELLDIRPLLTNCKYLVKLDVNRSLSDEEVYDDVLEEDKPAKTGFKGCGLTSEVIALVKEKFPNLDLVYREVQPPA